MSNSVTGTVTLSNLTLRTGSGQSALALGTGAQLSLALAGTNTLTSGRNFAGIEVALGRTLSITNAPGDETATLTVTGGGNGAGIGGNNSGNAGTVNIAGGIITAAGGSGAAGIGGGLLGAGGTVNVSGGTVTAQGGNYGAGIGGGGQKAGGTVTISGGRVSAIGGSRGAGIGGGSYDGTGGAGGAVTISGGTVFAQGSDGGMDIGPGRDTTTLGANTFAGGSIRLADASLAPIPRNNNGKAIFCATVAGFVAGARVEFTNPGSLPATYGTTDIFADDDGSIHLWIPNGTYTFTANGSTYTVELDNAAGATGVKVNGDEVAFGSDDPAAGWSYDEAAGLLRLTNAGPFTISGANTEGKVRVVVNANLAPAVTFSNLTLRTANDNHCIFTLGSGANVSLTLAGANELASGSGRPGIWVQAGETLSITNAPGDDAASLAVKGGANGAGIGSGTQGAAGTVNIAGGTITATSGTCAAGIGGGQGKAGGTVNISGGTVTAISTYSGAGIGGGSSGAGGTVSISGGRVTATGSDGGAGIGGGNGRADGTVHISGGTVVATGSYGGADIGPGSGGTATNSNTFTGGSIYLANDNISLDPSNGTARVWCVTVTNLTPNAAITVTGLGAYGVNDLFADDNGKLYLWLPNDNYDFTAGGTEYEATVSDADTTATAKAPPVSDAYLTFSSTNAFKISPSAVSWNGGLFYSTDTTNWHAFTQLGANATDNGSGEYRLYFRGTNNACITGGNLAYWTIDTTGSVACSGNIETLLDYTKVDAGEHPEMIANCFANLFKDCTALSSAPELPATNLVNNCYVGMFRNCTGLTNAPVLPATTLAGGCYQEMFRDCTSLAQAPALPALALPSSCYRGMFTNCTALATAPALPATTLGAACYQYMFAGCTSLTNAPALQAMTLVPGCYHSMFVGCPGLTQLPELPATNLESYCYAFMFADCTGITLHETGTAPTWGIPAGATEIMGWNESMLVGTGGTFTNNPVIGKTYYYNAPPPPVARSYLTFSSTNAFTIAPQTNSWDGTLECSTDGTNWVLFTTNGAAAATNAAGEYKLYICGTSNTFITGAYGTPGWKITAPTGTVACAGNIETLLDYATVNASNHPAMANYGFTRLFYDCAALSSAPELPATNLTEGCYNLMFYNCTGLLEAPELPAVTMAEACYGSMFRGCAALTNAPALPATNLADGCYYTMFSDCTSLTETPALPATTMMFACYSAMFGGCANLTETPALSAMTLANGCYDSMFRNCTSLTRLPALPATNLTDDCYRYMFSGCTSLTQAPTLPATTLASTCYERMFSGCTGLTHAPALPATTLAPSCYNAMFIGCTGLTSAPELPATNLAANCYCQMFRDCTSLTRLPELPATNLAETCYYFMFYNCTGIELNTDAPGIPWSIPANATAATDWNKWMFRGTSGTFTDDPQIGATYYLAPGLPDAPAFPADGSALVFDGTTLTIKIASTQSGFWYTLYSLDDLLEETWTKIESLQATGSELTFTTDLGAPSPPRLFYKVVATTEKP